MTDTTRRRFLQYSVGAGALLALPAAARRRLAGGLTRGPAPALSGGRLRKFREPLPVPGNGIVVATPSGTNQYSFTQREIRRRLHPDLPPTTVWAYDDGSGLAGAGPLVRHGPGRGERDAPARELHEPAARRLSRLDPGSTPALPALTV